MDQIVVLIFGLVVGSFLNVVIYRLPRGESIVWPGSRCTDCGTPLHPVDLVPVLSYLLLRGRCRYCRAPISWHYPVGEMGTAALFSIAYVHVGFGIDLAFALTLAGAVVVVSGIDLAHRRIPNMIVVPMAAVGFLSAAMTDRLSVQGSMVGMILGVLILGGIAIATRGGMGMGDAKLLGMIGAWTGWKGMIMTLFLGSAAASVIGLLLMGAGVIKRRQPIPFGPFLSLAGFFVYLYESQLFKIWLR